MKCYRIADLYNRGVFIFALRRLSSADTVSLAYYPDRRRHALEFTVVIWGQAWGLKVWLPGIEIPADKIEYVILRGERMIQDVKAHYRQQAVAR